MKIAVEIAFLPPCKDVDSDESAAETLTNFATLSDVQKIQTANDAAVCAL